MQEQLEDGVFISEWDTYILSPKLRNNPRRGADLNSEMVFIEHDSAVVHMNSTVAVTACIRSTQD